MATELATFGISSVDELYDVPEDGSSSADESGMNMTLTK